jgi:DNA polymerase-3 subunit gamma/tau
MADTSKRAGGQGGLEVGAAGSAAPAAGGYRVLARKYRPASFDDLIGQDAMVRTISNAFEIGRIPQAWILTGVRGVGKTTTARILARALNYELPDGSVTGPTIAMPTLGVHCQAIMESRHLDVLEMDAASHTGVDDVRQITDGVNYAPTSARYKVYIIDEVHMLSDKAFNAFLKTLEEPPAHAKFIFATTEIRKVPITVLSRCQRFDLRRVEADVLVANLQRIAGLEKVEAEPEALRLIARAAEGSVRDSLSLFDQAIAHAAGVVRADDIRQMLGLADRARIIDLFGALASGDIETAFREFRDQYATGADPAVVMSDLAEFVNFVTRIKIVPATADSNALSETERLRGRDFASKLSMRVLSRMWQMLLKGITEVKDAPRPAAAAEMVMVRIAYAADLPTPDEAIRALDGNSRAPADTGSRGAAPRMETQASARSDAVMAASAPRMPSSGAEAALRQPMPAAAPAPQAAPAVRLATFAEVVALAAEKRDLTIKTALENDVRLVRMEDGRLEIALEPHAQRSLAQELSRKLEQWTGRRWTIAVSNTAGQPTLRAQALAQKNELQSTVQADPRVQAVFETWPGAKIETVRRMARPQPDIDLPPADPNEDDDDL